MSKLSMNITQGVKEKIVTVTLDRDRFEQLASLFGFFNPEFLESLKRAESDYRSGNYRKIKSFKDLDV